eukprot:875837_1
MTMKDMQDPTTIINVRDARSIMIRLHRIENISARAPQIKRAFRSRLQSLNTALITVLYTSNPISLSETRRTKPSEARTTANIVPLTEARSTAPIDNRPRRQSPPGM